MKPRKTSDTKQRKNSKTEVHAKSKSGNLGHNRMYMYYRGFENSQLSQ